MSAMDGPTLPPEPLRRRLRARLLGAGSRLAGVLPESLLRAGAAPVASWASSSRHGQLVRENLRATLGDELSEGEQEQVAAAVFRHAGRQLAEWLRLASGAPPDGPRGAWIAERVELHDSIERLDRQLARGRGALIVTAHHGNWELLAAALRRRGHEGAVIGQKRARDSTRDWLVEMRQAYGVETLPQDSSPRRMLEVLRSGRILGVLCDLEVRRLDGTFLPFLGRPALTMTAPAALARAARVPLLPVRCALEGGSIEERLASRRYLLRVDEPLSLDAELAPREARDGLLRSLNDCFGRWIREAPEQWSWHQPRWRTAPGEYQTRPIRSR